MVKRTVGHGQGRSCGLACIRAGDRVGPGVALPQLFVVHVALPDAVNVVEAVTLPSELPWASKPVAVYACVASVVMVAVAGEMLMWLSVPLVTDSEAVSLMVPLVPVTV